MKLSAILKWMLILTLLAATVAGGAGVWAWRNSNSVVRNAILEKLEQAAPDLTIHLGHVELLSSSSIRLHSVEIRERNTNRQLARIEQVLVGVDSSALLDRQQVIVTSVQLQQADLLVQRNHEGRWNWQDYKFVSAESYRSVLPTVTVTDLRTQIQLQHGGDLPAANLILSSSVIHAVPSSADSYTLKGDIELPGVGRLSLDGLWDRTTQAWAIGGAMEGVRAGKQLLDLAQSADP
ncbi:MAG: AsmA family protein, partial [Planctomycetaceae bacterium]|nr:AsmA family protein [Planctomycetaceae bacterium]